MTRILVVDANEAFAALLQQELENMEMRADIAASGHEALRATAATNYAMAIVDMGLPDVPSAQLVRALRQEHPDLRLMVIPLEGDGVPSELADMYPSRAHCPNRSSFPNCRSESARPSPDR
jgi:DNA-binding response OmpR family regulator